MNMKNLKVTLPTIFNSDNRVEELKSFNKKCFNPSYNHRQLIKYKCQSCTKDCMFGMASKSYEFKNELNDIMNDKSVNEPFILSRKTNQFQRFCSNKIDIYDLLYAEVDGQNVLNPEEKSTGNKYCNVCKFSKEHCPIYASNNIHNVVLFDIDYINESGDVIYKSADTSKNDIDGVSKNSMFYKQLVNTNKPKAKTTNIFKSQIEPIKNKQNKLYKKFNKMVKKINKEEITFIEIKHLMILITELNTWKLTFTKHFYALVGLIEYVKNVKSLIKPEEFIDWYYINKKQEFRIIYKNNKYNIREMIMNFILTGILVGKNGFKFTKPSNSKKMRIDVSKLNQYAAINKVSIKEIFYEYYLKINPDVTRRTIADVWNISKKVQIGYEKSLKVYKHENKFNTNYMILNDIFSMNIKEKSKAVKALESSLL